MANDSRSIGLRIVLMWKRRIKGWSEGVIVRI